MDDELQAIEVKPANT